MGIAVTLALGFDLRLGWSLDVEACFFPQCLSTKAIVMTTVKTTAKITYMVMVEVASAHSGVETFVKTAVSQAVDSLTHHPFT